MSNKLLIIDGDFFYCGIIISSNIVIKTAPILSYMNLWTKERVIQYCKKRNFKIINKNMELLQLGALANKIAQDKGFWEMYDNIGVSYVQQTPITTEQLKWIEGQHIAVKIALCMTELGEAIEALRKGNVTNKERVEAFKQTCSKEDFEAGNEKFTTAFEKYLKDTDGDELGDTYIRLGDLCYKLGIDIDFHIKMKMKYNETRSKMHDKSY